MRGTTLLYSALGVAGAAIVFCGIAGFLVYDISARLSAHQDLVAQAESANATAQNNQLLHTLVSDTADNRATLDSLVHVDVLGIASAIQAAGKAAGATVVIGAASSQTVKVDGATNLHTLEFTVQATGSFPQVMRAAEFFQVLPLASSVEELQFTRPGGTANNSPWQLTARIRFLTNSDISS